MSAEARLRALGDEATPRARRAALLVMRRFAANGGDAGALVNVLEHLQPGVRTPRVFYGTQAVPHARAVDRIRQRRLRAVRALEKGAGDLLSLYDAPRESLEWRAVYIAQYPSEAAARASGGRKARETFRETLREVLRFVRNDAALKARGAPALGAKRATRRFPERILRERFELSRDDARALLAVLK